MAGGSGTPYFGSTETDSLQVNGNASVGGSLTLGNQPILYTAPPVSPLNSGVKCDAATDDAAMLNAFFASVTANTSIAMPQGATCVFKEPITLPQVNNIIIYGNGATLSYQGSATTGNLVTWGTTLGACSASVETIRDLNIASTTVMTGGDGFRLNDICELTISNVTVGAFFTNANFYNGIHINGGGVIHANFLTARGSNACEVINGDTTVQLTDAFHLHIDLVGCGYGLLIGGNCGGCYWDNADVDGNSVANVRIDQSQVPVHNNQFRFGPNFASDGGPPIGIDIEDTGIDGNAAPFTTNATSSFSAGSAVTIPVAACPATLLSSFLFDTSLIPPRNIGPITSCSGTNLVVATVSANSAGAADNLTFGHGPGPGQGGVQFFCEGCWISTTATCLKVGSEVNWEIHLIGARIENCSVSGILAQSDQIRMYLSGGAIGQNGIGVHNTAPGAHIEFQANPSFYDNGTNMEGLSPTVVSGCGGTGAQVAGTDYDFHIDWGAAAGTSCVIAFAFSHDSSPQGVALTGYGASAYLNVSAPYNNNGLGIVSSANITAGDYVFVHNSGAGF
jgi:hypothetical protein